MIKWVQFAKKGEARNAGYGDKVAGVDIWHGVVGRMKDAVTIQGPTQHNDQYRVMTLLRWKDAETADFATLREAQSFAASRVRAWLDASGLTIQRQRRAG